MFPRSWYLLIGPEDVANLVHVCNDSHRMSQPMHNLLAHKGAVNRSLHGSCCQLSAARATSSNAQELTRSGPELAELAEKGGSGEGAHVKEEASEGGGHKDAGTLNTKALKRQAA